MDSSGAHGERDSGLERWATSVDRGAQGSFVVSWVGRKHRSHYGLWDRLWLGGSQADGVGGYSATGFWRGNPSILAELLMIEVLVHKSTNLMHNGYKFMCIHLPNKFRHIIIGTDMM